MLLLVFALTDDEIALRYMIVLDRLILLQEHGEIGSTHTGMEAVTNRTGADWWRLVIFFSGTGSKLVKHRNLERLQSWNERGHIVMNPDKLDLCNFRKARGAMEIA
jgi:hypothetical protein